MLLIRNNGWKYLSLRPFYHLWKNLVGFGFSLPRCLLRLFSDLLQTARAHTVLDRRGELPSSHIWVLTTPELLNFRRLHGRNCIHWGDQGNRLELVVGVAVEPRLFAFIDVVVLGGLDGQKDLTSGPSSLLGELQPSARRLAYGASLLFLYLRINYCLHCFPVTVPLHDPHSAENMAPIEHEVMVLTLRQLVLCLLTRLFPQKAHFIQF